MLQCVSRVRCVLLDLMRKACCFLNARHRPATMYSLTFHFHAKTTGEKCPQG